MYKVVTQKMQSLGLRKNPTILTFPINKWVKSKNISEDDKDSGGIWVTSKLSNAKLLKKYMLLKHNKKCRIFFVEIGKILYQNSYRTKTDKVKLIEEIF